MSAVCCLLTFPLPPPVRAHTHTAPTYTPHWPPPQLELSLWQREALQGNVVNVNKPFAQEGDGFASTVFPKRCGSVRLGAGGNRSKQRGSWSTACVCACVGGWVGACVRAGTPGRTQASQSVAASAACALHLKCPRHTLRAAHELTPAAHTARP